MIELRTVEVDTANGKQSITGATAKAIIKALESADPNAVISFGFEVTNEIRFLADNSEMLLGGVRFVAYGEKTVLLLGQEAVNAVKREKLI